ncbi:8-oxoguanine deaminase, partial [Myxococcota bacterium]
MSRVLIQNALAVATQDADLGEIRGGDVLIDGPLVAEVGVGLKASADEVIDATGRVVVPGLVNTHHHLYQVLTRNLERV